MGRDGVARSRPFPFRAAHSRVGIESKGTWMPNAPVEQEWPRLSEPYRAPNGYIVETLASLDDLKDLGERIDNALSHQGFREGVARHVADGRTHVYRVSLDGAPVSCGELKVVGHGLRHDWNRGTRNMPPPKETDAAIEAFVAAVNSGEHPIAYSLADGLFVRPLPAPGF